MIKVSYKEVEKIPALKKIVDKEKIKKEQERQAEQHVKNIINIFKALF